MKECDKICEEIISNPAKMFDLMDWFSKNLTHQNMVELLATFYFEDYKRKQENKPIPISKEDFEKFAKLFKIKGYKILPNGTVVEENRGGSRYRGTFDKSKSPHYNSDL